MNDLGYVSIKRILTICVLILAVAILIPGLIIHFFTEYFTSRVLTLRQAMHQASTEAVSYTHLTLPTIYSV